MFALKETLYPGQLQTEISENEAQNLILEVAELQCKVNS
jgi:hypothetical protein